MGSIISASYLSVMDLTAGTLVALSSEWIFDKREKNLKLADKEMNSEEKSSPKLKEILFYSKLARVILQHLFIVFSSSQIRDLYISKESEDPLGGMMFILAAGQTPNFWKKVRELAVELKTKLEFSMMPSE